MFKHSTREAWLGDAVERLRAGLFADANGSLPVGISSEVPTVRVSVGFPGGRGSKHKAIGQYWKGLAVADGVPQVFISPVIDDAVRALDILCHELVHACVPEDGHGAKFKKIALAIGLTGKMTATVAGPALTMRLNALVGDLGAYPHSRIDVGSGLKKQGTRLNKVACKDCGYTVRVTRKWLEVGAPICPCNGEAMAIQEDGGEEGTAAANLPC